MKLELEQDEVASIAAAVGDAVAERFRPLLKGGQDLPDPIMDVKGLAVYLKVQQTWVYKQVQNKTIPHFHAGRYPRFRRKEIEAWVMSQSVPATAPPYPALRIAKS